MKSNLKIWGQHNNLRWRHVSNWPANIKLFFRKIKWSYQRIQRGFSDFDVWELEDYLIFILRDTLNHLANTTHTYPGDFYLQGNDDGYEKWISILRSAANHFDASLETYYTNPYEKDFLQTFSNNFLERANTSSEENTRVREKYYREMNNIYQKQLENRSAGFAILDKYFDHLWD